MATGARTFAELRAKEETMDLMVWLLETASTPESKKIDAFKQLKSLKPDHP